VRHLVSNKQCTIAEEVVVSGTGLFFGRPVKVRFLPAPAGHGVVFERADLPSRPRVAAKVENVPSAQRWTALKQGEAEVRMVEHVLAALAGLGIDNCLVQADAVEMPAGDGSALCFVSPLLNAGIVEQDVPSRRLTPESTLGVADKDVALVALPQPGRLSVTYVLDYGRHFIKSQALTMEIDRDTFVREIAPARTYVLRPEVDAFVKSGMGRGATPENTVVLEEDGRLSVEPRFPDECARHKILDLVGDLYLAGGPLHARVLGYKSGHAANVRLARAIRDSAGA
jgi:UDP-3-O-acyl N-acetylglucosamine deacetylase